MKYWILLIVFSFNSNVFGQSWNWWSSGYISSSGGGTFINVDDRGTNMEISGLVNESETGQIGSEGIQVGIDNQKSDGIQHEYHFSFSNPVSVRFVLDEINVGPTCYNDFLSFTGSPEFSNQENIFISGNEIFPTESFPTEGMVTVTYNLVTSFTITHGEGIFCNPGHINIGILDFGFNITSLEEVHLDENIVLFPNPIQNQFVMENKYDVPIDIQVINLQGHRISEHSIPPSSIFSVDVSHYLEGVYFVQCQKKGRLIESKKILIKR